MDASIIIPAYNGGELLKKTLKAIFSQETTKSFEVVVIDSGSSQDPKLLLQEFNIKLFEIPNHEFDHGLTRDLGAGKALGEFVIFINQDAEPGDSKWLDMMLTPFVDSNVVAVQGGIRERNDMRRFFWHSCGERFYFTSESKTWIRNYFNMGFSTVNCAIRLSEWHKHPFGKMSIFEDKGFQRQVHLKGNEIVYSEGFVYHTHDYTYDQLRRRCQDEGYGWRLVGQTYSLTQAILDTLIPLNYARLVQGILSGKVKRWSEVIFPLLRPFWVYKGNHFNNGLLKS
jgi:rhamnosyltransferase